MALTEKTTKQVLTEARNYIADPKRWSGSIEDPSGRRCAIGAITAAATGTASWETPQSASHLSALAEILPEHDGMVESLYSKAEWKIFNYNDSHSHACVIAAFDRAIEAA